MVHNESRAARRIKQACGAAGLIWSNVEQVQNGPRGGEWVLQLVGGEILRARTAREMTTIVIPRKVFGPGLESDGDV